MAKRPLTPKKRSPKKKPPRKRFPKKKLLVFVALAGALLAVFYTLYLDATVRSRFEGKRFALPARVYARPLELYPGVKLAPSVLSAELALLGYREVPHPKEPGTYRWRNETLELVTRPFVFGDGPQAGTSLRVEFARGRIGSLSARPGGGSLDLVRLDPVLIGGIYPGKNEDRVLVGLEEVPAHLVEALLAVEDQRFYSHHGIDPRGIARALVATASGRSLQGGSTLTQQLVKNFYLSAERTLHRKLTEMVMAVLLEVHYSKEEILQTYLNEVYLGQDGNRSIHGFGLGATFFFDKPLSRLGIAESALLVGLLKGPSYYSPRSQPQRALERRNLVLDEMAEAGFITDEQLLAARAEPLGVIARPPLGTSPYPAFLALVHRQLQHDYRDEDLRSEGLQIFTTLDPHVQRVAEKALGRRLAALEKARGIAEGLQGAVIVTGTQNAEVQAVVGGRDPRFEGFNRALDALRPIGSLIKPVVYLTALQRPERYTLVTRLDDGPLLHKQAGADDWAPENYDREFHGQVPLRQALIHSYNLATVSLGLDLGVPQVMANLKRLGVERDLPGFASSLLGSNALSPLEVAQIYQTLAGGGFRTPLRSIREVLTAAGETLQRYPLNVEPVVDAASLYLLTLAMQDVVREGTAEGLVHYLPSELGVAGKTGTTDAFRDSWFAGFTGDRLAVAWVGRDDNQPAGLTGAAGAMAVWGEMMAGLDPEPLILPEPDNLERVWIDGPTGLRSDAGCRDASELPFVLGSAPTEQAPCRERSLGKSIKNWIERIFQP